MAGAWGGGGVWGRRSSEVAAPSALEIDLAVDQALGELVEEALRSLGSADVRGEEAGETEQERCGTPAGMEPYTDDSGLDWDCAVCLNDIPLADTAIVRDCRHSYCLPCILQWAERAAAKDVPCKCPKCKAPFSYLFCYRKLDGELGDELEEESVTLLLRTRWYAAGKAPVRGGRHACTDRDEELAEQLFFEFDDDDDAGDDEELFFVDGVSRNQARYWLGNRRFGQNGYVRAGRMNARPKPSPAGKKGKGKAASSSSSASASSSAAAAAGSSPGHLSSSPGSSSSSSAAAAAAAMSSAKAKRLAKQEAKEAKAALRKKTAATTGRSPNER
mmetsp:Transcript_6057/g.20435  ORF Transcript_6057/g.20435 Transcript_6057/m.20435 type:complete len:331 (-) Transcript_6057:58-1050(-)|eukprot:CAMPEP_0170132964 /NCGR_PEP_ID=MMETSP0033_2-20121228/980_1 /TAXON_ID=195969 /ORGANISM="Dolichomastix tenuilepis, Strain CCMP3274" /LENGTH=330 /DNA_ID=CAMNT_0010368415 /DNA_START=182 /DNA_END=1174 /DNA_ORIENTATION=-